MCNVVYTLIFIYGGGVASRETVSAVQGHLPIS